MIFPQVCSEKYQRWNKYWGAPFGYLYYKKFFKGCLLYYLQRYQMLWYPHFLLKRLGLFSVQTNNSSTRIYEYPWAYFATPISSSMKILEIGGGLSGFQFVLSTTGAKVMNIDPMEKKHNYNYSFKLFTLMNRMYHTDVRLHKGTIDSISLPDKTIDRVFCLSVLEHLGDREINTIMKRSAQLLKPHGRMICTVDLFLDLYPFSNRKKNKYGRNISIKKIIYDSGLELYRGKRQELYGFDEFNHKHILGKLYSYYIAEQYPVLSQAFVLKKKE